MKRAKETMGKYVNNDYVEFIGSEWKEISEQEKYERVKNVMNEIDSGAWKGFRASFERTIIQQNLLSIAKAAEERLSEIKKLSANDLNSCVSKQEIFFRETGSGSGDEAERKKNMRTAGKLQKEYRRAAEERGIIGEVENANSERPVKTVRINKLIQLAEHEKNHRPEEFRKITERAKELLEGSKEFENYRIFKRALEEAGERGKGKGQAAKKEPVVRQIPVSNDNLKKWTDDYVRDRDIYFDTPEGKIIKEEAEGIRLGGFIVTPKKYVNDLPDKLRGIRTESKVRSEFKSYIADKARAEEQRRERSESARKKRERQEISL
jgi:hypothetical protein